MHSVLRDNKYADAALIARYESAGTFCGQLAIALGLASLVGWAAGVATLVPGWLAMRPGAALCLVLAGTSLFAARKSRSDRRWRLVQLASATIVSAVGLATLVESGLGPRFGTGQFLRAGPALPDHPLFHGAMAVATATNFMLLGAAVAILDTRARRLAQLLALLAMGIATLALLGHAYGVSALHALRFFSTMTPHAAIGAVLVGAGALLVRPAHGVVAVLVSGTVGGVLARRLLPLAFAIPFVLGWLRIEGERRAFYDSRFGVALTSLAYMILFSLFVWRTAEALRRSDDLRLDAEHTKQLNQAQMSGLIESAMDAIVMLDNAQRIIVFNPAAEKMFGCARADILGSPLSKLLPQRFHTAHDAQLRAFGASGSPSRRMGGLGSVTAMRADGTEFPAEASISQFDLGQGICYTAIVRDITERMRIERELHASERRERDRSQELSNLLFAVPAAVCIAHDAQLVDVTGNQLYDRWFRDFDAGTPHQLGANPDAAPPEGQHQESGAIRSGQAALRQAASGVEVRDYEFRHAHRNGTVRYLFGNAMPLWDEQGSACGAISAFVDVTELKLSELAMLSVTAGSVAKSDYITHMTHELRTPLGTMLGYAQLLEAGTPSPTQLVAIEQIIKAGWYLRDLITEVQDLATIEADSAGLACESVSIDALLDDLRAMIEPLLSKSGLCVTLVGTTGLDIRANPVRIKQVMLNLLSNAIKYNRLGGSIDVSRVMDGQAQVRIGVRDTGHGLTQEELASLFQPFNRLGQERGKEVGTGVGLVVTKKLVESMGGTIGAESEVGSGSLFWFNMPVAAESARPVASA
ncbi:ATP-binding protein [Massilia glaciei]|uniref:histidine kinase n=1 Tax=Massilia glaciei TaxID=1524097 RepID=A0A2U2HG37_9BURK|nr:ATP-binding protein [Massilia glaciei]PWF43625.1 PAS domain-containing sensor histidine kinase [Massilia glaciei]